MGVNNFFFSPLRALLSVELESSHSILPHPKKEKKIFSFNNSYKYDFFFSLFFLLILFFLLLLSFSLFLIRSFVLKITKTRALLRHSPIIPLKFILPSVSRPEF